MPVLTFFLSACFASVIQLASRSRRNSCSSMVLAALAKSRHSFANRLHSDVETSMSVNPLSEDTCRKISPLEWRGNFHSARTITNSNETARVGFSCSAQRANTISSRTLMLVISAARATKSYSSQRRACMSTKFPPISPAQD
jgi:hypothetical protein